MLANAYSQNQAPYPDIPELINADFIFRVTGIKEGSNSEISNKKYNTINYPLLGQNDYRSYDENIIKIFIPNNPLTIFLGSFNNPGPQNNTNGEDLSLIYAEGTLENEDVRLIIYQFPKRRVNTYIKIEYLEIDYVLNFIIKIGL